MSAKDILTAKQFIEKCQEVHYRTLGEDERDWELLKQTLENYLAGKWETTCWLLNAMYGHFEGERMGHSLSVNIKRQNGQTVIETAAEAIEAAVQKVVGQVNNSQTDERYLQNIEILLPSKVGDLQLTTHHAGEYLTEPRQI